MPLAFLTVFFVYPVLAIIGRGLAPGWHVDLGPFGDVVTDGYLRHVVWFTIWQAALSTALTLAIGIPGVFVLSRYRFRGRAVVRALVTVPFVLPTIVVGSAFASLLGPGGPLAGLGLDQSLAAILVAHVFFNYAVVVRTVGGLWSHLDPRQEEAARMLGASRLRAFREVTLPALRPAITAAAAIVFLFTFTSFGVILVLGGPRFNTLETEIYRQTAQLLHLPLAATLTVVQLVAITALLLVTARIEGRHHAALRLPRLGRDRDPSPHDRRATAARRQPARDGRAARRSDPRARGAVVHPPAATASASTARSTRCTSSALFVSPVEAIGNSLRFAAIATLIAVVVGGCGAFALAARRNRGLDTALSLPLGVSAVTVGFGFLIALDHPPVDLRSSPMLVPIAQALVAIPFVVRTVTPVLRAIDPRLREAAAMLGASPARTWREVDVPIRRAPCSWPRGSRSPSRSVSSARRSSSCGPTTPRCRSRSTDSSANPVR